MFRQRLFRSLVVPLVSVSMSMLPSATAPAAEGGRISGSITLEVDGSPVHGARVLLLETGGVTRAGHDGRYSFEGLPAGRYTVLAMREHLSAERQLVELAEGGSLTVDFALALSHVHEEVTVTAEVGGTSTSLDSFSTVASLDGFELARNMAGSLGEVLENEPGVRKRGFGPGSSRPVIRGFDGDRVLITQDGIRTGDLSSQSGDHGVTVDPGSVQRIEVLKGPVTLLYGSNAVGGVVNAITPHDSLRNADFEGVQGQLLVDGGTANQQAGGNGSVQYRRGGWGAWAGGGARRSSDYASPGGTIENSATRLGNGTGGFGYFGDRVQVSAGYGIEQGRFGVPFAGALHGDDEREAPGEEPQIDLDTRRQSARFDLGVRQLSGGVLDSARLIVNWLGWRHEELEIVNDAETVGTTFDNDSWVGRLELGQKRSDRLSGRFGVWGQTRDYTAIGEESLSPPVEHDALAGFVYEELQLGRFRLQLGGRIEHNDYAPDARLDGSGSGEEAVPEAIPRSFTGVSGSLGLHARLGDSSALVANLTRSSRAPALEELYNYGPHVGNRAFEIGNPDLDEESSLGIDVSLRHQSSRGRGQVNVFYYDIGDFVFPSFTGELVDGLLEAEFIQGDSRFLGADAKGSLRISDALWLHAGLGWVDAELTGTREALPRIPPIHGSASLELAWRGFHLKPELEWAAGQDRVFRQETSTAGYATLDVTTSYVLARAHLAHILTLRAYNLTDALYRNHTSFIKDLAPEMGRGVMVSYALRFH